MVVNYQMVINTYLGEPLNTRMSHCFFRLYLMGDENEAAIQHSFSYHFSNDNDHSGLGGSFY